MARNSAGGGDTLVKEFRPANGDALEDLTVWDEPMERKHSGDSGVSTACESENITLGFKTYARDLPSLLKNDHEGHLVAYDGVKQIGIAASDEKLYQELVKRPDYARRKHELFVTRISEQDADELGVRI